MTIHDLPHSSNAKEWGWIRPDGTVFKLVKTNRKQPTHSEMLGTHGLPEMSKVFQEGYVRYSIGKTGDALFHFIPLAETKERVIKFIQEHNLSGKVHLDLGGYRPIDEIEMLPTPDAAIEFLLSTS